jgi:hypothetical protein
MKKKMKIIKPLGSMNIFFDVDDIVEVESTGELFKIAPVGKCSPSIAGVPSYYLKETSAI